MVLLLRAQLGVFLAAPRAEKVAQIFNLLYRRFSNLQSVEKFECAGEFGRAADWKVGDTAD